MTSKSIEQDALSAVDEFIAAFNSREPERWASAQHYPHARPSFWGPIKVIQDAQTYIAQADWTPAIKSGWDHSAFDSKKVIHVSESKIHVAGQWSRYNAEGQKILTTPVMYVVTRIGEKWGIQSRFGSDYTGNSGTSELETLSQALIQDFVKERNRGSISECAELMNFPHVEIHPGQVLETKVPQSFAMDQSGRWTLESVTPIQVGKKSANLAVEFTSESKVGKEHFQSVILITDREGHLGIQAWSSIKT